MKNCPCGSWDRSVVHKVAGFVISITILGIICGFCGFFIGSFRSINIKKYNKVAQFWNDNGLQEFSNNSFYIYDVTSQRKLDEMNFYSGDNYPVRDACNQPQDPPEGCILTNATYYYGEVYSREDENWMNIVNDKNTSIFSIQYQNKFTYIMDPEELECQYSPEMCSSYCNIKFGKWNREEKLCHIDYYIHELCIRVQFKSGKWVLDEPMEQYSLNPKFHAYDSDMLGCYYNNNWNSIVYGVGEHPVISVTIRSYTDSFIAASEYTKGCSSDTKVDTMCFGKTHIEERLGWFMVIQISIVCLGVEFIILVCYCIRHSYKK